MKKKKRSKIPRRCVKCEQLDVESTTPLTRHHIEPVVHYGRKHGCPKCWLCQEHHRTFEAILVRAEGPAVNGKRIKRERHFYHEMLLYYILF